MDDNLELPTATPKPEGSQDRDEEEQSSGDEDQGPDWTKIPYVLVSSRALAVCERSAVVCPPRDPSYRSEARRTLSPSRREAPAFKDTSSIARVLLCSTL